MKEKRPANVESNYFCAYIWENNHITLCIYNTASTMVQNIKTVQNEQKQQTPLVSVENTLALALTDTYNTVKPALMPLLESWYI